MRFAEAWSIAPDDPISVILNGRIQTFRVAGIAHSPEFVYASRPGNPLPDDRTLVVLWADEDAVAAAFDMQGAFNNPTVLTRPRRIDALRHRGARSPPRALWRARRLRAQGPAFPSILSDELAEQRTLAIAVPMVFFAVAAFLLNVVLGRLVESQREQIAALKALGFPSLPIGFHYLQFVAAICALGSLAGIGLGLWYGHGMMNNYRPFFRFPELTYTLPVWLPAAAVSASFIAAAGRACGRSPGSSPQTGGGHAPAGPRHLRPRTGRQRGCAPPQKWSCAVFWAVPSGPSSRSSGSHLPCRWSCSGSSGGCASPHGRGPVRRHRAR